MVQGNRTTPVSQFLCPDRVFVVHYRPMKDECRSLEPLEATVQRSRLRFVVRVGAVPVRDMQKGKRRRFNDEQGQRDWRWRDGRATPMPSQAPPEFLDLLRLLVARAEVCLHSTLISLALGYEQVASSCHNGQQQLASGSSQCSNQSVNSMPCSPLAPPRARPSRWSCAAPAHSPGAGMPGLMRVEGRAEERGTAGSPCSPCTP